MYITGTWRPWHSLKHEYRDFILYNALSDIKGHVSTSVVFIISVMLGQHAVFAAVCDTTDIYLIHHDSMYYICYMEAAKAIFLSFFHRNLSALVIA